MLFMMIIKATKNSEAGNYADEEHNKIMDKYNEELIQAGVRVMAKGLYPSSNGLRIFFPDDSDKRIVTEGPFDNIHDLITGFFIINVKSKEEAIEWVMRAPDPHGFGEGQIELRQIIE